MTYKLTAKMVAVALMTLTSCKTTPVQSTLTPQEQELVDQTKGWTIDELRAEYTGCVTVGIPNEICGCAVLMIAKNLTYPQLKDAAKNKPNELREALHAVFSSCTIQNAPVDDGNITI